MKKVTRRGINKELKSKVYRIKEDGDIVEFRILRVRNSEEWDYNNSCYKVSDQRFNIDIECFYYMESNPGRVYTSTTYRSHMTNRWIRWSLSRMSSVLRSSISMYGLNCQDVVVKQIKRSAVSLGKVNYDFS